MSNGTFLFFAGSADAGTDVQLTNALTDDAGAFAPPIADGPTYYLPVDGSITHFSAKTLDGFGGTVFVQLFRRNNVSAPAGLLLHSLEFTGLITAGDTRTFAFAPIEPFVAGDEVYVRVLNQDDAPCRITATVRVI